tara:strand:+ start:132 stop:920 length:789 start_codon:yes stop_codon:yes gene_type:complete
MKQANRIPRRVAGSLLYSLNSISERLETAIGRLDNQYKTGNIEEEHLEVNKKFIRANDAEIVNSINSFWTAVSDKLNRSISLHDDAFMTIAKHPDLRVRYVAEDNSCGLVITTGCLRRLLELSANIVDRSEWIDNKTTEGRYICDPHTTRNYSNTYTPHFLRVLDILRYMDETDVGMLEISLKNFGRDIESLKSLSGYGYGSGENDLNIEKMYPFLSDRYQPESWKHYLTTLYAGMFTNLNQKVPTATGMTRDIALSELNIK